jgi:predicted nucleotidyltransferase
MTSPPRILPVKERTDACVKALSSTLPVEEIWIFGSQATGQADPYLSDLDLLVVLSDNHGIPRPHRQAGLALAHTPAPTGAEVIVMTRSQFHGQIAAKTPLLAREARTNGRKIYERR